MSVPAGLVLVGISSSYVLQNKRLSWHWLKMQVRWSLMVNGLQHTLLLYAHSHWEQPREKLWVKCLA